MPIESYPPSGPPLPDLSALRAIVAQYEAANTDPVDVAYGDTFADVYDDWYDEPARAVRCIDRLRLLAATSRTHNATPVVVELGAGTGLLTRRLLEADPDHSPPTVVGLDLSAKMLQRFSATLSGLPVRGDLTRLPLRDSSVDLAFCSYNTLFNVLDPIGQAHVFAEVSRILHPGGHFAIETIRPEVLVADTGESVDFSRYSPEGPVWSLARHDPSNQRLSGYFITEAAPPLVRPWHLRYSSTRELDDWAGRAMLLLLARSANWEGHPIQRHSDRQVSIWVRAGQVDGGQ